MTSRYQFDTTTRHKYPAGKLGWACRSVAHKAAAGMPAFVPLASEGVLDTLDRQGRAAEGARPLIQAAVLGAVR